MLSMRPLILSKRRAWDKVSYSIETKRIEPSSQPRAR